MTTGSIGIPEADTYLQASEFITQQYELAAAYITYHQIAYSTANIDQLSPDLNS